MRYALGFLAAGLMMAAGAADDAGFRVSSSDVSSRNGADETVPPVVGGQVPESAIAAEARETRLTASGGFGFAVSLPGYRLGHESLGGCVFLTLSCRESAGAARDVLRI